MTNIFNTRILVGCIIGLGLSISACTDLEPEIYGQEVDGEDFPSSELPLITDPQSVYQTAYNGLNDFTDQAGIFSLQQHTTDELIGPTRGTDWFDAGAWQQMHAHNWTPTNPRVIETFTRLANPYFAATQVIAATTDAQLIARSKFLRAWFMGHMADVYGQVPFREANEGIGISPRVLSRSEAAAFVIQDLEEAIPNLPDFDSGNPGLVSKQAAQAYLARFVLNKGVYDAADPTGPYAFEAGDMQKVIDACDAVINSGFFQLAAPGNYFLEFSPDNSNTATEHIFALQFETNDGVGASAQNRAFMTTHYNQEVGGWNGFATISEFYNSFEATDERLGADPLDPNTGFTAGFQVGQQFKRENGDLVPLTTRGGQPLVFTEEVSLGFSNEASGIRVIKYYPDFASLGDPSNDYVLLRLAEAYLNKAEAQFRLGDNAGALATINLLRANRQGASMLSAITEQAILDERGFEMYWEGIRRSDLIRFGQFLRPYSEKDYESDPRSVLFPIPLPQLAANPNLQQNPGY